MKHIHKSHSHPAPAGKKSCNDQVMKIKTENRKQRKTTNVIHRMREG